MFHSFSIKTISIAAFSFVLLFCVFSVSAAESEWLKFSDDKAAAQSTQNTQERQDTQGKMWGEKSSKVDSLLSAKGLMETNVKNNTGDTLGSVEELVYDKNQKTICYVIVSSDMKEHPVPWSAFDTSSDRIMLNIDKGKFKDSPTISSARNIDQLNNSDFRDKIKNYYSEQTKASMQGKQGQKMEAKTGEKSEFLTYSELSGMNVKNPNGEKLGDIRNVVIDIHQGNVVYGLVGIGGLLGAGERLAAVPWSSITVQAQQKTAFLEADKRILEESIVKDGNIQELAQADFARKIHQNFGAQPYWDVLGYVPPQGQGQQQMKGKERGQMKQMAAWQPDSKYNQNFKPDSMKTIDGTIQNVGTFIPELGTSPGLELKVTPRDGGEPVTVQCGPMHYQKQRDMNFKNGTEVTVTGSATNIDNKDVIMATSIKAGDKTLELRDERGMPRWSTGEMQHQSSESRY